MCEVWSCLTLCKLHSINSICLKMRNAVVVVATCVFKCNVLVLREDEQRFYFRGQPIHQLLFLLQLKHLSVSGDIAY